MLSRTACGRPGALSVCYKLVELPARATISYQYVGHGRGQNSGPLISRGAMMGLRGVPNLFSADLCPTATISILAAVSGYLRLRHLKYTK